MKNRLTSLCYLFIFFITVNKYRFYISVIGYINVQIIGIGYKKSISVDYTRGVTMHLAHEMRQKTDTWFKIFEYYFKYIFNDRLFVF